MKIKGQPIFRLGEFRCGNCNMLNGIEQKKIDEITEVIKNNIEKQAKQEKSKEIFDDLKKYKYPQDKNASGQLYILTIGSTRFEELKKKHLEG